MSDGTSWFKTVGGGALGIVIGAATVISIGHGLIADQVQPVQQEVVSVSQRQQQDEEEIRKLEINDAMLREKIGLLSNDPPRGKHASAHDR